MNDRAVPGNFPPRHNLNPGGCVSRQCSWSHIYKGLLAYEMRSIKGPITNLSLKSSALRGIGPFCVRYSLDPHDPL